MPRVAMLTTGEVGIEDKINDAVRGPKHMAGQAVRSLDIPASPEKGFGLFDIVPEGLTPKAFAESLKASAAAHHGWAGPELVRYFIANREASLTKLRADIAIFETQVAKVKGVGPQGARVATTFGIVYAALGLAVSAGILPWEADAPRAIIHCYGDWARRRGGVGDTEPMKAVDNVREFLATQAARFVGVSSDRRMTSLTSAHNQAGYWTPASTDAAGVGHPAVYRINATAFKEACGGLNPRQVAKHLMTAGILKGRGMTQWRTPNQGMGKFYILEVA